MDGAAWFRTQEGNSGAFAPLTVAEPRRATYATRARPTAHSSTTAEADSLGDAIRQLRLALSVVTVAIAALRKQNADNDATSPRYRALRERLPRHADREAGSAARRSHACELTRPVRATGCDFGWRTTNGATRRSRRGEVSVRSRDHCRSPSAEGKTYSGGISVAAWAYPIVSVAALRRAERRRTSSRSSVRA